MFCNADQLSHQKVVNIRFVAYVASKTNKDSVHPMFVEAWIYSARDTICLCPVFKDQINNVHLCLFLDALVNDHWSIWRAVATMTNSFTERPEGKLVTVTSSRIISGSLKHAASPGTKVFLQFVNRSLSAVAESSWRLKYSFGGSSSLRRCYQVGFQEDHQR